MRVVLFLSLLLATLLISCDRPGKFVMSGELGGKFESVFELSASGDQFEGVFYYTEDPSSKIPVNGTNVSGKLRLEEFNNTENKLTGTFLGEFDGLTYEGYWQDPEGKNKVPFRYSVQQEKSSSPKVSGINVDYEALDKDEHSSYHHGLRGIVNGVESIIFPENDYDQFCFNILEHVLDEPD